MTKNKIHGILKLLLCGVVLAIIAGIYYKLVINFQIGAAILYISLVILLMGAALLLMLKRNSTKWDDCILEVCALWMQECDGAVNVDIK